MKLMTALIALIALVANSTAFAAESSAAAYFSGKTIEWIVPFGAGGAFDLYSRMIAPYFARYTGARVLVLNKPGAGGLLANNSVYAAAPNGLTVELVNGAGSLASQIVGERGVRYDMQ